jgi:Fibronectin type III domain
MLIISLLYPLSASAVLTNPATSCASGTCTVTFSDPSDFYNYTVPSGLTYVNVTVKGGQGGGSGGQGGTVTGRLNVAGGNVLTIYVGGAGTQGSSPSGGLSGGRSSGGAAANGGRSDSRSGGGHSEIMSSGNSLVIAGGGGGQGGWAGGAGGVGGGSTWASGISNGGNGSAGQAQPGTGGSSTVGSGGAGNGGSSGSSGSGQIGGAGGAGSAGSGGGGGGGYRGGGGGGGDTDGSGSDGGGGGGGSSFYRTSNFSTAPTTTAGGNAGVGSVVISYPSTAVSTFTSTNTTPTNSTSAIIYSLRMSENVTGMEAVDFENSGTATGCVFAVAGSNDSYTVTVTLCSDGTLIPVLKSNSVSGSTTGPAATSPATTTILLDRTAPTISSVTAPANQTYIPSNSISFTLNTSETVTVSGTPRLSLTIGSTTRYATYASGSNSRALVFTYAVQTSISDLDTDGITLNTPLELNGGAIADLATNAMSNFAISTTSLASVLVAQKPGAPTIDSITATSGQLAVAFTAGASNGSAITNYEFSTNNGLNWTTRSPVATTSPLTITGLTNGQSYNVRLRAINSAGSGESSTAVSATPTAVVVAGGSNISMTYGGTASSSQFTASGGTSPYVFSLSSTPTGVTISNGVVSASATTPAGTYTQNVVATDSGSQTGSKQITISVAKASTTISISLPNAATNAALGGAVTITATVSRAGSVNFQLGGSTLSGCGSAAAASTTATCTPTDTSNFETSTTTTLTITVVNGVSSITLALAGGTTTPPKGQAINIIATIDQVGRITFLVDGKRIPGCFNILASAIGNRSCSWKPSVQKAVNITARLVPTNTVFNPSVSSLTVQVVRRSGAR